MTALHTPGPWDESNGKIFGTTATAIATVHKHQSPTVTLANASLIKASPELLEALQNVIAQYNTVHGVGDLEMQSAIDFAHRVLAKATGQ